MQRRGWDAAVRPAGGRELVLATILIHGDPWRDGGTTRGVRPALLSCPEPPAPCHSLPVVTPNDQPQSAWLRVYCPLGMADLFGAYDA